jgi:hypothetical protein
MFNCTTNLKAAKPSTKDILKWYSAIRTGLYRYEKDKRKTKTYNVMDTDEGVRTDTGRSCLMKPAFAAGGSVTAELFSKQAMVLHLWCDERKNGKRTGIETSQVGECCECGYPVSWVWDP